MERMALLVPGGRGQLGRELARLVAAERGCLVHAPGSSELDVTDAEAVTDAVESFDETARDAGLKPVVINAAAYTAVDKAEDDGVRAAAINSGGAAALAESCRDRHMPLVHVSTDYVFAGDSGVSYEPEDTTAPRTVYGRTKLDGERAVLESGAQSWIVRTSWVYGARGANFVKTMARLERERETLTVVDDQTGSPTWSADLARGLVELAGRVAHRQGPARRVLHCTNADRTSWFDFARAVFSELGADPDRVRPCSSAEYPTRAHRPAFSVLSGDAWREAGCTPLRPWREALSAAFATDGDDLRGA